MSSHADRQTDRQTGGDALTGGAGRRGGAVSTPGVGASSLASALGPGGFLALQRLAGNAAAASVVQRKSFAADFPGPIADPADFARKLDALSTPDLIDTLDELTAKGTASVLVARPEGLSGLPAQRQERLTAALHATASMINPRFFIAVARSDIPDQAPLLARAEKVVKGASTPEYRIAVMGGGLLGMIKAGTYEEAFLYLNGLDMVGILETMTIARGAANVHAPAAAGGTAKTMLDDLKAHIGDAKAVNVTRLKVAIEAVNFDAADYAPFEAANPLVNDAAVPAYDRESIKQYYLRGGRAAFSKMIADPNLSIAGQFFWSGEISKGIMGDPRVAALNVAGAPPAHTALFLQIKDLVETAANRSNATAAVQAKAVAVIAAIRAAAPPGTQQLVAMAAFIQAEPLTRGVDPGPFKKKGSEFIAGWGIYQQLNGTFLAAPTPDVAAHKNVFKLHYLSLAEPEVCGFQASFLGSRFRALKKRSGAPPPNPKAQIGGLPLATSVKRDDTEFVVDGVRVVRGDVCQYGANLGSAIAKIKVALDGGWIVTVRVMSGWGGGGLTGEHSFLLIGYQGNAFTVADSDPGNEGEAAMRSGFTTVYYDPAVPRFSTAVTDANFPVLVSDTRLQANRHHRYQILSVTGSI
jgi:hypothetical protein